MLSALIKQKFPIVLLALGVLLIILSFFKVEDITKLNVSAYPTPIFTLFGCGIALVLLSIPGFLLTETQLDFKFGSKVKSTKDGYLLRVGRADLNIRFGQIEQCDASEPGCVVALPSNEFFDDECINDNKSALGAYILKAFPNQVSKIRKIITQGLAKYPAKEVEKTAGLMQKSYGIAKCIYLDKPLGSNRKILLVSVTTKRHGEGLRSEPHFLFEAIKAIQQFMGDHRLTELHVPIMGSGHGGLRSELALLYMVLAVSEQLRSPSGHHLRSVTIVVFQNGPKGVPQIPRKIVRRILSSAASV